MKILQVMPNFQVGGAEVMCRNLVLALKKQGHAVTVVSLYDEHTPMSQEIEEAGVCVRYLDKKPGLDVSMVPKLRAIMKEIQPDAVHTHLDVIKYAAAAAKLAGVKVCVHTMHSLAEKEAEGPAQKIINTTYFRLGWSVPVAISPGVRSSIVRFYGVGEETVPVVYNGTDLSRCIPKENYQVGETVKLLHVGRFDLPKNHMGLLAAFQKLHDKFPQCRLTLVGDGELRPQIEEAIRERNLEDCVVLAGMQRNVYPYLQDADIFVLPSVYEGNPMSILEAMGTGLPIAATEVGGIPDMLTQGKTALLTTCDVDAICAAWETLVCGEALRAELGRKAKADSVRFSSEYMAREYVEIYGKGRI